MTSSRIRAVLSDRRGLLSSLGLMLLLVVALLPLFLFNSLSTADGGFFANYQRDSEGLVVSKVVADESRTAPGGYGLTFSDDPYGELNRIEGRHEAEKSSSVKFSAYTSQVGVLGYFYSGAYQMGLTSLGLLHGLAVLLFTVVIAPLAVGLRRITNSLFAACFVGALAFSPWIVVNVRNLYWSPWTWFLPMLGALAFAVARTKTTRTLAVALTGAAFLLRFAAGFEFLTTFILMAAGVPLIRYAFRDDRRGRLRLALRDAVILLATGVLAFLVDFLTLAVIRGGGSVVKGVVNIYELDVLRRTYPELGYTGTLGPPDASPLTVLDTYVFHSYTNLLGATFGSFIGLSLGGGALWLLIAAATVVCVVRLLRHDRRSVRDGMVLLIGAAAPFSWYVLAPSHSAAHPNIVFVLLYLLLVGNVLFIVVAAVGDMITALHPLDRDPDLLTSIRGLSTDIRWRKSPPRRSLPERSGTSVHLRARTDRG